MALIFQEFSPGGFEARKILGKSNKKLANVCQAVALEYGPRFAAMVPFIN